MNLYILLDYYNLDDKQEKQLKKSVPAIISSIQKMVEELPTSSIKAMLPHTEECELSDLQIGVEFSANKVAQLKPVLDSFNALAKEHKQDFVLGIIDRESREDICYFGFEEGLADRFQIAQYLGL